MGNFTRRVIAFIMGMVVMLVTLLGGTAGAMYWAFKNLSLSKLGVMEEDASGIADATVEDLVALVLLVQSDPESFTFAKLEEQGIDVFQILESLGLDLSKADKTDYDSLKNISPFLLFSNEGLYQISFSTIFAFIPKGEDGMYPLFSEGARDALRGYSLGYLLETDNNTGEMRLFKELSTLKIGSLFPSTFTETYDSVNGEYNYDADNPVIEKFGNIKVSFLTKAVSDTYVFDIGQELHEGDLEEIGKLEVADFLSDLIAGDDEDAKAQIEQTFALLGNLLVKDLFAYDEELGSYAFDTEAIFSALSIGGFLGYVGCTETEDCPIHEGVGCDGEWYLACTDDVDCPVHGDSGCEDGGYKKVEGETAEELIMLNLANLNVNDIIGGEFAITDIVEGVYLGHSLGYKIKEDAPNGYCDKGCELTESHEEHDFYWVDDAGEFVGELFNDVSNTPLVNAINGEGIDLEGIVNDATLGELLGKYNKDGAWYDDSDCTIPTANETAMEKILLSLYDKKMTEITSDDGIDLGELLEGIKMGELMGYTYDSGVWYDGSEALDLNELDKSIYDMEVSELVNGDMEFKDVLDGLKMGELMGYEIKAEDGYCDADCAEDHKHNFYWVDKNDAPLKPNELDKALYRMEVSKIIDGNFEVDDILDGLKMGELMGYTFYNDDWYTDVECTTKVENATAMDKIMVSIYGKTMDDVKEGLKLEEMLEGIMLGELMGYSYVDGVWYKGEVKAENAVTFSKFDKTLYETLVSKLVTGEKDFKSVLGELRVGELMGNTYEGGVWYKENGDELELGILDKTIYEVPVTDILNNNVDFKDVLGDLYVGQLMNYTIGENKDYCKADCAIEDEEHTHKFYWLNGTEPVSNLDKTVADIQLSEIFSGNINFKSKIDNLTLGDVIDMDAADTPTILKLLKDTKVSQISTKMNELELGEVMGYTKCSKDADCEVHENGSGCDGKWYRENGSVVDGLNAKIANYTFKRFADDGFDPNEFTLGDVIKDDEEYEEGSIFYLLDVEHIDGYEDLEGTGDVERRKNIPVSQVSVRVKSGVTKAKLKDLKNCGVFSLTSTDIDTLDKAFEVASSIGKISAEQQEWQELTLNEFIQCVIAMLPTE